MEDESLIPVFFFSFLLLTEIIIGGTVGGLAAVGIPGLLIWYCCCYKKSKTNPKHKDKDKDEAEKKVFLETQPA